MKALIIILVASSVAFSQQEQKSNNIIYIELLGNGLFSSLNYEYAISNNFSARIGLGYAFSNSESNSGAHHDFAFLPVAMLNYLFQIHDNNYLEIGAGALISASDLSSSPGFESTVAVVPTFALGYRYSPKNGGFFFSAAFDMFSVSLSSVAPWAGLGLGYRF
jgi:hypothetical protein